MSASLIVCENADLTVRLTVRKDLERFMVCFIPDGDAIFKHIAEGPDDMLADLRSVLTQTRLTFRIEHK